MRTTRDRLTSFGGGYPCRHRLLQMAVVLLVMLDTLRRMFADSPLINFLMLLTEVLVLGFVAYEVVQAWLHRKGLRRFVKEVTGWIESGERLQENVPVNESGLHLDFEKVTKWEKDTEKWIFDVERFLSRCSTEAMHAFRLTVYSDGERRVLRPDGQFVPVTGELGNKYQLLGARLENLRRITESADIYR